jgi:hypothetical protein
VLCDVCSAKRSRIGKDRVRRLTDDLVVAQNFTGMRGLRVHLLFILFPDCVHWQEKRGVRKSEHDAGAFKAGGIGRLKPQKLEEEEGSSP